MKTQTDFFKFKVNPKMAYLNYNNNNKGPQFSAIIQKYPVNNNYNNNNNISFKNTNYNHRYYLNSNSSNNIINSYKKSKLSSFSQKKPVNKNKTNTGFYLSNINNFANLNKENNNSINSFMNNNLNKHKLNNVNKPNYKSYSSTMPRKTNSYSMKSTTRTNFYSPSLKKLKIVNNNDKDINYNNIINKIKDNINNINYNKNNNRNNNINNINNKNINKNINTILLSNILNEQYPMYQDAKHSDNSFDIISGYGVNTYKGIMRNYNEDRVSIIVNAKKSNNYSENYKWPKISFFAIYDGHAGNKCSEYLKNNLHNFIFNSNDFPNNPMKSIEQGFKTCENNFMKLIHDKTQNQYNDFSGSCAIIILIIDDICYTINLGDSRAIYSYDKGNKFYQLSRDHKPDDLIEKKRIYKAGGSIFKPNISQFCIGGTLNYGIKESDLGIKIPYRILPGRLAVSFF